MSFSDGFVKYLSKLGSPMVEVNKYFIWHKWLHKWLWFLRGKNRLFTNRLTFYSSAEWLHGFQVSGSLFGT